MLGGGIYPGMITATIGTVAAPRGRRHVDRDRASGAFATSGGTRCTCSPTPASRSPGSTRSRPATSSCSTGRPPITGARSTSPRSRCSSRSGSSRRSIAFVPAPAARRRGAARRPRRRLARDRRPQARPSARARRASSSSGASSSPAAGGRRTRSRSRRRRAGARCGSRSRTLGDFTSHGRRHPARDARPRRGAVRRLHRGGCGPAREGRC